MSTDSVVNSGASDDTSATLGETGDPTPEQIAQSAKDKKLADEAAKTRIKLRESEKQVRERDERIAELQAKVEAGTAPDPQSKSEVATLKRELEQLRVETKARAEREKALEEKARRRTVQSTLASIAAEAKLLEPSSAIEILEKRARVADDDKVVFTVKDPDTSESIEVDATTENLRKYKLLPGIFHPPTGERGSGGRAVSEGSAIVDGVDLNRALTDPVYYRANRDKIMAARANRQK
jgi:hypothetical protein